MKEENLELIGWFLIGLSFGIKLEGIIFIIGLFCIYLGILTRVNKSKRLKNKSKRK
jgi:4-amino-4-deoxy-L-arabinose transferase-like glycosyltransferase